MRVVSVGPSIDNLLGDGSTAWGAQHSIEFCGGTHVQNTTEIYKFVLLIEEGIAKGVRRIVAVTGPQAAVEATLKGKHLYSEAGCAGAQRRAELGRRRCPNLGPTWPQLWSIPAPTCVEMFHSL